MFDFYVTIISSWWSQNSIRTYLPWLTTFTLHGRPKHCAHKLLRALSRGSCGIIYGAVDDRVLRCAFKSGIGSAVATTSCFRVFTACTDLSSGSDVTHYWHNMHMSRSKHDENMSSLSKRRISRWNLTMWFSIASWLHERSSWSRPCTHI